MSSPADRSFRPQQLLPLIVSELPRPASYWVGFSGGLDSTVLLHALAVLRAELPARLRAVHIDHCLQPSSGDWAVHCRQVCDALGIELTSLVVDARAAPGESPEAAARRARYAAISGALGPQAMLLTAHHLDDQAETLLLQLLRGAGVEGLAAMPMLRPWQGRGTPGRCSVGRVRHCATGRRPRGCVGSRTRAMRRRPPTATICANG